MGECPNKSVKVKIRQTDSRASLAWEGGDSDMKNKTHLIKARDVVFETINLHLQLKTAIFKEIDKVLEDKLAELDWHIRGFDEA